ncbi:MAG TPA: amidohydrolase family protein [Gemmatimonadaceae bacterium]|nr:amidohydrolase family protein [Gemmatimonadaceae bacterium]
MKRVLSLAAVALIATNAAAQSVSSMSKTTRDFVTVSEPVVALTNVTVIDGTGAAAKPNQTIVIRDGKIAAVGAASAVTVPQGARSIDLSGQTVIPGLIGMHDHLFYTAAGGREASLGYSGPRLYLASGVTTIRTTGSVAPYADIGTKHAVDVGQIPGPHIFLTAPYITGAGTNGTTDMAVVTSPEAARRFVAYWAQEGATWIKAYTDIKRADLKAAIDEAHKRGLKVTGHLCSVSFQEAVDLGIDNLEHGFMTNTDFDSEKKPDMCPANSMTRVGMANASGETAHLTIKKMIDHRVPMTSTLAVFEPFFKGRPVSDERTLDAMAPEVKTAYLNVRSFIDTSSTWMFKPEMLKSQMAFEKEFVDAGGLLAAGVDPTGFGGALPGYGDQRNYELFIEAGFTPAQAVQIMSANGAKILGVYTKTGSVEAGKAADLIVLNGDLVADPSTIRKVTTVFKDGVGYDSPKLIASVKGRVGIM